ncbi:M18 family aminopeptidase [Spirochaeta africana]|uniref:M18 family aminopeptidase n=1 Tax=Spirochaeta africana (strain ATCC 700263 / DSM 8902 / Z-7692) TaxID=889378 RepID=H9UJ47_SPIAZ|nr:M18 family aminopeptidase [Spirochaeta africana]AFG37540.1 aspartyl aminopeptidase [Spirochaeta africana DSM 8902]
MTHTSETAAQKLREFLDSAATPYHVQRQLASRLQQQGAVQLSETDEWDLSPGQLYFLTRNESAVIVFRTGRQPPSRHGFRIIGAHTDSPALKLKLSATASSHSKDIGLPTVPVEVYGAPLLYTWFDRSLGIAGRITTTDGAGISTQIVTLPHAGAVVPSLAIHLDRTVNDGFAPNPHSHMRAVLGSALPAGVGSPGELVARAIGCTDDWPLPEHELFLYDPQPAVITGLDSGLIQSGRIDNAAGCYTTIEALLNSPVGDHTQVGVFFDAEEIGSRTTAGADSGFLVSVLQRIVAIIEPHEPQAWFRAAAASRMVSNDGAHAVHPSRPERHDSDFSPRLNGGPVIKLSAAYRYASTGITAREFRSLAESAGVACQYLVNRADIPAGSTIGPFAAAQTGIPTVDVGLPMLAMHSIRETAGLADIEALTRVLQAFLKQETHFS